MSITMHDTSIFLNPVYIFLYFPLNETCTVQLTDHQYNTTNTKSEIEQITILYSTNSCELQREKEIETAAGLGIQKRSRASGSEEQQGGAGEEQ